MRQETTGYEALLAAGEVRRARARAEAELKRHPASQRALLVLARIAAFEGEARRAETLLERLHGSGKEESVEALLVRAALLTQRGDKEAALTLYRRLTREAHPPRVEAFFALGYLLEQSGDALEAHAHLSQAVELAPKVAIHHFHLARVLFTLERLPEAFHHLEQSLRLDPRHAPSYQVFALALQAAGQLDAAEHLLRKGLKALPDEPYLLNTLCNVLAARGDLAGSVATAEALVRVQPDSAAALGNLARMRMAQRRFPEALALCRRLVERGQATARSRSVEALLLESREPPDIQGAIAAWTKAMELDPRDWSAANNLGNLLMRLDEEELPGAAAQARTVLEEARRRALERPEPLLNLAVNCARLGDPSRARSLARELLARGASVAPELRAQGERLLRALDRTPLERIPSDEIHRSRSKTPLGGSS